MRGIVLFIVFTVGALFAGEYHVDKKQNNLVKFISDAPVEDFEGVSDYIDGYIYWEGDTLTRNSKMYFEVKLSTLDTGIGLRNRHMRENYLETAKYPFTYFKGNIKQVRRKSESNVMEVTVAGQLFIHGVEQNRTIDGTISKTGNGFRIRSQFTVKLSDYNIDIPSVMFYKIDEEMEVQLDFYVKPAGKNE